MRQSPLSLSKKETKKDRFLPIFFSVIIAFALLPTFWKIVIYDYHFSECLRTIFMDVSICALLVFVLAVDPLRFKIVWGGLFIAFVISFYIAHPPQNFWDIFGYIVVLGFFGTKIFPRLHLISGYVILGLFISYIFVIRIMALGMDYSDAKIILEKKLPAESAKEGLHLMFNFGNRYALARERTHWFVHSDEHYNQCMSDLTALAKVVNEQLAAQNVDYLQFNTLSASFPGTDNSSEVEGTLQGRIEASAKDAQGNYSRPLAEVQPFAVKMKLGKDGYWRIAQVPTAITFALVK